MKQLGDLKYLLGIEVVRSKHGIFFYPNRNISLICYLFLLNLAKPSHSGALL